MHHLGMPREATVASICYHLECSVLKLEQHSCGIRDTYDHAAESTGSSMSEVEQRARTSTAFKASFISGSFRNSVDSSHDI